jgi:RNA polymerase sigma factor (sigma-70 family)
MNDLEFVQNCVRGDRQALDQLISNYSRLIYTYIYSILKYKGYNFAQEEIQDIFQELFYLLIKDNFRKLKSFQARGGCSLASWLRQVVVNFTIDYLRRTKNTVSLEEEIGDELSLKDVLSDGNVPADSALLDQERIEELKDCINRLDKEEKFFLKLHFHKGIALEKLKSLFGASRGAIDVQKHRIIQKLKACFKAKGFMLDF